MLQWIAANAATIVICMVLGILLLLAARHVYKARKSGGCIGCGGDCCHCSQAFDRRK